MTSSDVTTSTRACPETGTTITRIFRDGALFAVVVQRGGQAPQVCDPSGRPRDGEVAAFALAHLPIPQRCTLCENDASELIPYSRERLCWDCVDLQLDLLAAAVADLPVTVGAGVPGHVSTIGAGR